MSEVITGPEGAADLPPAESHPFRPAPPSGTGTWSLTWHGIRTVTVLELRQRVRSTRWVASLIVWVAVLGALTVLTRFTLHLNADGSPGSGTGPMMFGIIVLLVMFLGMVISPALSATSVNGDRTAGVLAIMQSTLLSPAELAVGKLLAAWASALALLVTAIPFVVWAYFEGGTPIGRLLVTLTLLALTLLVVCAIGLGYSAATARTSSSAVLTYLTVTFIGLGLPILFLLTTPLVTSTETVTRREEMTLGEEGGVSTTRCETSTQTTSRTHTERTWWLLAASPYVLVADAAPRPARRNDYGDPLTEIRSGVRELRLGPPEVEDWCADQMSMESNDARQDAKADLPSVWPLGLAADLLIGAGFLALTVRRLRTPADRLPRGTRIA
jgi:ABC-2 type transport system permease protein